MIATGCRCIHIGGGEPFLHFDGLLDVVQAAKETGINIEYIETNSSWFKNEEEAIDKLNNLTSSGIFQLLISISPFHNEFIPFNKVKGLLSSCRKSGMRVFPWIMDFYDDIDAFDDQRPHSLSQYKEKYGDTYLQQIPRRYWTHFGGRAVQTYKNIIPLKPLEKVLRSPACKELADTSHFHIDLYQNYIPGLCSGLAIKMSDLGKDLDENEYPILSLLFNEGIGSLFEYARNEFGFKPQAKYLNKCHLCNDIRLFIVNNQKISTGELQPEEYYTQVV